MNSTNSSVVDSAGSYHTAMSGSLSTVPLTSLSNTSANAAPSNQVRDETFAAARESSSSSGDWRTGSTVRLSHLQFWIDPEDHTTLVALLNSQISVSVLNALQHSVESVMKNAIRNSREGVLKVFEVGDIAFVMLITKNADGSFYFFNDVAANSTFGSYFFTGFLEGAGFHFESVGSFFKK